MIRACRSAPSLLPSSARLHQRLPRAADPAAHPRLVQQRRQLLPHLARRYGGDMAEIRRRYGGDTAEIWQAPPAPGTERSRSASASLSPPRKGVHFGSGGEAHLSGRVSRSASRRALSASAQRRARSKSVQEAGRSSQTRSTYSREASRGGGGGGGGSYVRMSGRTRMDPHRGTIGRCMAHTSVHDATAQPGRSIASVRLEAAARLMALASNSQFSCTAAPPVRASALRCSGRVAWERGG